MMKPVVVEWMRGRVVDLAIGGEAPNQGPAATRVAAIGAVAGGRKWA
jgi:hypothetical protein